MGFHVPHATRDSATSFQFSTTGLSPPLVQYLAASSNLSLRSRCPTTPKCMHFGLGCSPFAHHYLGNRFCFLLLWLLRCFNSPGSLSITYVFSNQYLGFPHSDTSGSKPASNSPEHFVGNHVLLRLCVPRYPPWALSSLTTLMSVKMLRIISLQLWVYTRNSLLLIPNFITTYNCFSRLYAVFKVLAEYNPAVLLYNR